MSPAKRVGEKTKIEELQAALQAETELRLALEDRLQRAEEEFEEFILAAAHDLREPLRAVSAYCELLARKDVERSEAETEQFRHYVREGVSRIQALIAGMVDLATAASCMVQDFFVDMNEVFREAASSPVLQSGESVVTITRDPLPSVKGDSEKLVKVARHLLDNAARYRDSGESRIHVSARREGSDWLFTVKDNGLGIQQAFRHRIFEPFRRLHGREYAGCGLGLTFCRKAIESHGGRIWVESVPGEGSTFCFTLPDLP